MTAGRPRWRSGTTADQWRGSSIRPHHCRQRRETVVLDVGGALFRSTLDTLTETDSSMLAVLSGGWIIPSAHRAR